MSAPEHLGELGDHILHSWQCGGFDSFLQTREFSEHHKRNYVGVHDIGVEWN